MKIAFERLNKYLKGIEDVELESAAGVSKPANRAKLRPWFQDFDLGGVVYGADKVSAQIKAFDNAAVNYKDLYGGWMLWDSANIYTPGALKAE